MSHEGPSPKGGSRDAAEEAGSDGYRVGSEGYQAGGEDPDGGRLESEVGAASGPGETGRPTHPFAWASEDYPSLEAFLDRIVEERAKVQGGLEGPRPRSRLPTPSLPGAELGDLRRPSGRPPATRQVGVRLTPPDYELLTQAAELYGVAPSTLARMLVRRGAQAIVAREDEPRSD
ncbi:MAG: hypothetical protein ACRDMH_00520 [Solirubrobacterales bacterium]